MLCKSRLIVAIGIVRYSMVDMESFRDDTSVDANSAGVSTGNSNVS